MHNIFLHIVLHIVQLHKLYWHLLDTETVGYPFTITKYRRSPFVIVAACKRRGERQHKQGQ